WLGPRIAFSGILLRAGRVVAEVPQPFDDLSALAGDAVVREFEATWVIVGLLVGKVRRRAVGLAVAQLIAGYLGFGYVLASLGVGDRELHVPRTARIAARVTFSGILLRA